MKRRKIIIFVLILIVALCGVVGFVRKTFVRNGQLIKEIQYKSENLIVHIAKEGGTKRLVILGSGYSLSIDENNRVINHDPLMMLPDMSRYGENTTVMSIFYPFECEGLEVAGKELSDFINSKLKEYQEVILIGHSKCGVCFANAARWIERKITVVTVSAPFSGTLHKEKITDQLSELEAEIFCKIFIDHKVNDDVTIGSEFIQNADYSGLKNHNHINIISVCPETDSNILDFLLIYIDKKGVNGDGIVPYESQKLQYETTREIEVEAIHATSMEKALDEIKKIISDL